MNSAYTDYGSLDALGEVKVGAIATDKSRRKWIKM